MKNGSLTTTTAALVVLVVVLVVVAVACRYCYHQNHHRDHQNHHQENQNHHHQGDAIKVVTFLFYKYVTAGRSADRS